MFAPNIFVGQRKCGWTWAWTCAGRGFSPNMNLEHTSVVNTTMLRVNATCIRNFFTIQNSMSGKERSFTIIFLNLFFVHTDNIVIRKTQHKMRWLRSKDYRISAITHFDIPITHYNSLPTCCSCNKPHDKILACMRDFSGGYCANR